MLHAAPLRVALVLTALLAAAPVALAAPPSPKRALEGYLKANDKKRAKAWGLVETVPPLTAKQVPALRDLAIKHLYKKGRSIGSKGRNEWFDTKKDKWEGLYLTSGKGDKGLIIALHGGGAGSGDCGSAQSSFSGVVSASGMRGIYPEVLVKTEKGWTDPIDTEKFVLDLIKAARRSWGVDPNRIYVTGHSMGGYGTWTYGGIHADVFAAGAAFAGAPSVYWEQGKKDIAGEAVMDGIVPSLYNLPLFCYQSLDDPQVPPAANVCAAKQVKAAHETDKNGWKFVYEEVNGRGHAFPEKGPGPGVEWMVSHTRDPRPVKIVWQPVRDWKTTFYWVRWDKPWLGSTLTAVVNKDENRIDITVAKPHSYDPKTVDAVRSESLKTLGLYLDERVVDLEREIVVTVDGEERYRGQPERSLVTLIRSAEEREDPEYVFPVSISLGK